MIDSQANPGDTPHWNLCRCHPEFDILARTP